MGKSVIDYYLLIVVRVWTCVVLLLRLFLLRLSIKKNDLETDEKQSNKGREGERDRDWLTH